MNDELALLADQVAVPLPLRETPAGVRLISPTGEIGYVPEDQVEEAIAAGAQMMTPEKMRELRQAVFMEHGLFKHEHKPIEKPRKRRSIVTGRRRR